ncbi:PREDICTED: uncharacterized protein LOC106116700 isoform X1 [Papilio xuthus]|uniref:Uncharacterized protein LOC106116700 isoform X1 n=1 Tax=Papilio xuthus TaxID=66420 RepID=A0AAJ6Z645_PAPXU|nr:PREDICTED: uncharacterized protein LOC106116700 isoform X1 [Papilio xuthus]
MSVLISSNYIETVVNDVAVACYLKEWSYIEESLDAKAQNYFGVLIPISLEGKINNENVSLKLMLKLAPTDDRYRVSGAVTAMFAREIFVYSKVFSKYQDLQKCLQSQYIIPKCYYVCKDYCKEALAIQNMCESGYLPFIHSMFLDVDHLIVSLKSLAKFHALSFVMEFKETELFAEVKNICLPLSESTNKRYIDILLDRLEKALLKFDNTNYVPMLQHLKQNCTKYIEDVYSSSERNCLCHGDIWKENILYKYEDNKPVSACLIDFQTARISSPAFDVLYLITSSANSKLRQKHFVSLIEIYYSTLLEFFKDANFENVYSHRQLEKDLKTVGPACFIVANTALWLSSGLQQEGHVRSKKILQSEFEIAMAVDNYKAIIKGILDDFIGYGYLPEILS